MKYGDEYERLIVEFISSFGKLVEYFNAIVTEIAKKNAELGAAYLECSILRSERDAAIKESRHVIDTLSSVGVRDAD